MSETPSAAAWDRAVRDYAGGVIPVAAVRGALGVSYAILYRELDRRGVPRRSQAGTSRRGSPATTRRRAAETNARRAPRVGGARALIRRIRAMVVERIDAIDRTRPDRDPERTDRRLIHLARLLTQLRGLDADTDKRAGGPARADAAGPVDAATTGGRSVADLRDDLLGHLGRLRAETRARRLDRDAVGAGASGPPGSLADPLPARSGPAGP